MAPVRRAPPQDPAAPSLPGPAISRHEVTLGDQVLDLGPVIQRTRLAFRDDAGATNSYQGGTGTYDSAAEGRRLRVAPRIPGGDYRAAPLELTKTSFGRANAPRAGFEDYRRSDDGSLIASSSYGQHAEHIENREDGVEQYWSLPAVPEGDGDLVVRIATAGQIAAGDSRHGLHFRDPIRGLGIRYGLATWRDATGREESLVPRMEGQDIVLRVPEELVDTAAYPVVLDPIVSAEYAMDTPIVGPAADTQIAVSVGHSAALNFDFLVVWHDKRRDTGSFDIYGAHVTRLGVVVEQVGFLISDVGENFDHKFPQVVWNGAISRYAVLFVWSGPSGPELRIHVLTSSGTTATQAIGRVDSSFTCQSCTEAPNLAWNLYLTDDRYMAVWRDLGPNKLRVTSFRLAGSGSSWSIANQAFATQPNTVNPYQPHVSGSNQGATATNFLVTWDDNGGVLGTVYNKDSQVVAGPNLNILSTSTFGNRSGLTGSSNSWLVVGSYFLSHWNVRGAAVSTGGAQGSQIDISNAAGNQILPAVFGNGGGGVLVAWQDAPNSSSPNTLRGRRATVSGSQIITLHDSNTGILIGGNGEFSTEIDGHYDDVSHYFLAWTDLRNDLTSDIYGTRVKSSDGTVSPVGGFLISQSANREHAPAIAACGNRYLVAWADTRNGTSNQDIYGSILNSDGTVAIQNVAISTAAGKQETPAVACNGTNFYVVWADFRNGTSNSDISRNRRPDRWRHRSRYEPAGSLRCRAVSSRL